MASIAGAHAVAARLPGPARRSLTQAADLAYTHGLARAAAISIALLVICAALRLILLPANPAKAGPRSLPGDLGPRKNKYDSDQPNTRGSSG